MENVSLRSDKERVLAIDALRGFAVMGIVLLHNIEHFNFYSFPETTSPILSSLDNTLWDMLFFLFSGKAYAIFALLFGFTFHIQYSNRQQDGKDFGWRFLWRLVLLIGFATLNAAFFPAGDVLLLFVVTGIVLFLVRKWSDKAVLAAATIFLLQPIE